MRLLNGHKHRKTSPRPSPKASSRRQVYDEGEPDVAGYEESLGSGDDGDGTGTGNGLAEDTGTGNGLSLEIVGAWDRRRDFHSPETRREFIEFGEIGESTTDDLVTVEKNKKNEQNEARLDDREQLERKAFQDFETLMRFDSDPIVVVGDQAHQHKHPGRLFYIDNATQGESFTDEDYKEEIDVDRIGEEDEGEEDDPSEWKYAGDGDNKIPSGPIIHNTGATAKIFAETLARRLSAQSDDDDDVGVGHSDETDLHDVKRSTVTMVLRSRDGDVGGDSASDGGSGSQSEMTSRTTVTLTETLVSTKSAIVTDQAASTSVYDDAATREEDMSEINNKGDTDSLVLQATANGGQEEGPQEGDLPEGEEVPVGGVTQVQQDRDQNSQPPDTPPGIPASPAAGPSLTSPYYSSDPASGPVFSRQEDQHTQEEIPSSRTGEEKPRVVLATSTATLTLSPALQPSILKDKSRENKVSPPGEVRVTPVKVVQASRISLRTATSPAPAQEAKDTTPISWASPSPAQEESQQESHKEKSPEDCLTTASATASKVHFRTYASFAPSESGEGVEEAADEALGADSSAQQDDDMGNALGKLFYTLTTL